MPPIPGKFWTRACLWGIGIAISGCTMLPPDPPPVFPQTPAPPPPAAPTSSSNTGASPDDVASASQAAAGNADGDADAPPAKQSGSPPRDQPTEQGREQGQADVAARDPTPSGASGSEQRGGGSSNQTAAEREAALEREFEKSLAAFDGSLSRERQRLEEAAVRQRAVHTAAGSGSRDPGNGALTATETTTSATGAGNIPDLDPAQPRESARDQQTSSSSGSPPSDAPGGQGDDIVARQIREAAESETDPALREKLWEEYRKYKQQNQT